MQGKKTDDGPMPVLRKSANMIRHRLRDKQGNVKRESFLDDSSVNLLQWIKGDRAIFWVWAYIRRADYDTLLDVYVATNPKDIPYLIFGLDTIPSSSKERSLVIKEWFKKMQESFSFLTTKKIMKAIQYEWGYICNNIKNADWLRTDEASTTWMWERLKKEPLFENSVPFWFNPVNSHERFIAINGTLDFFLPQHTTSIKYGKKLRNDFLKSSERAYKKRTIPKERNTHVQVNVKLQYDTKIIFDKMVSSRGTTQSSMIEWLIRESWQEGKSNYVNKKSSTPSQSTEMEPDDS